MKLRDKRWGIIKAHRLLVLVWWPKWPSSDCTRKIIILQQFPCVLSSFTSNVFCISFVISSYNRSTTFGLCKRILILRCPRRKKSIGDKSQQRGVGFAQHATGTLGTFILKRASKKDKLVQMHCFAEYAMSKLNDLTNSNRGMISFQHDGSLKNASVDIWSRHYRKNKAAFYWNISH